MGICYCKTEDKELIIAQTSSGGTNGASLSESENHVRINNILLSVILVIIALIIFTLNDSNNWVKQRHKKWIGDRVNSEMVPRMRLRMSGRSDPEREEAAV
ncbi:unnamed protein product [Colias eurytheme]|nr:unnamed protein product [Colias eurytheme]